MTDKPSTAYVIGLLILLVGLFGVSAETMAMIVQWLFPMTTLGDALRIGIMLAAAASLLALLSGAGKKPVKK